MASSIPFLLLLLLATSLAAAFDFQETTIDKIQTAFRDGNLTSYQLVQHYINQIQLHNPYLHAVIELNPDALSDAARADAERKASLYRPPLHGIPILLKDNIATRDRLNTTAGSFALLKSVVPRDAGVVTKLRLSGAIVLGKASMTEWMGFRSTTLPLGWSARGGQGINPYNATVTPCGSSSGSAISVAANLALVSLGTETDGSIICPAGLNSVVGIRPTVGLTSRSGVVPIAPEVDTVGPLARTVADAVAVLEAIVGFDAFDAAATAAAAKFVPAGGYRQFLKLWGLKGKRVGILRPIFFDFPQGSTEAAAFEAHFNTIRQKGATLIDNLEIANVTSILNQQTNGEATLFLADFKFYLNAYLNNLISSPVRSLQDIINFNNNNTVLEKTAEYGQNIFLASQTTNGIGPAERSAIANMANLSKNGLEKLIKEQNLDAVVFPDASASTVLAIGGFPAISVPAGYDESGVPFAICFAGLKGSESKLIEIAYAFEQATKVRKPPTLSNLSSEATNFAGQI